jgi:predicted dehydrogenase
MPRTRVAVIGLGSVAEPHLITYQRLRDVEVVGAAEPRTERRTEIALRYGVRCYGTFAELATTERPEVACILTPARTHRALTEECAGAGVHVLCEKPMALSLEDSAAMLKACNRAGVQFFYGSSYRHLPTIIEARRLIREGAVGTVRMILEEVITGEGADRYQPLSDAHYPEGGPGGGGYGLVDHGIHMLDIFPWLCDSPIVAVFGLWGLGSAAV